MSHEVDLEIDWGGWTVVSSPSSVEAHLGGADIDYYILEIICEPEDCYVDNNTVGIWEDEFDSDDLVTRSIEADAVYLTDQVQVTRSMTIDSMTSRSYFTNLLDVYRSNTNDCCAPDKDAKVLYATGWAVSERNVVLERTGSGDMSYVRESDLFIEFPFPGGRDFSGCCVLVFPQWCSPSPEYYESLEDRLYAGIVFVSFGVTVLFDEMSNTPPEEYVSQGVYAVTHDGMVVRLGRFEDAEFDEASTPEGGFEASGSFGLQFSVSDPDMVGLKEILIEDVFAFFDGDIDRDGDLTCADRTAFFVALNSEIGELGYNPRADFNLDGVVDGDDRDAFHDILCFGDFNCDGAVNSTDYIAFLNAWSASDPSADYNGDGTVNSVDFTVFLNAYNAGCP